MEEGGGVIATGKVTWFMGKLGEEVGAISVSVTHSICEKCRKNRAKIGAFATITFIARRFSPYTVLFLISPTCTNSRLTFAATGAANGAGFVRPCALGD